MPLEWEPLHAPHQSNILDDIPEDQEITDTTHSL